jgi:squalene-hopene/tetraprenyl-beta-curcumene cyclase
MTAQHVAEAPREEGDAVAAPAVAPALPLRDRAARPVIPRPARAGSTAPDDALLDQACRRAVDGLLAQQRPDGHWSYRLETNVCMEAEYVMLGRIIGRADPAREQRIVTRILEEQQADGGWAVYRGGPSDADCTVEAYVALRAAGVPADDPAVSAARVCISRLGGVPATRVFTRMWLACCGLHPWQPLPELPPELVLLPTRFPLSLPRFASWARATIVPLTVVLTLRPATSAIVLGRDELSLGERPGNARRNSPTGAVALGFRGLDRALHAYRRSPWQPGRARALRAAEQWILDHQEADGGIGGIQPPMAYQCLALHALGYRAGNPAFDRAWNAFEGFILEDDRTCEVQACLSPVWDTALAMLALADLGLPRDHPALLRAGEWLLARECTATGDWTAVRRSLPAGGWPFEYDNQLYPDIDDTAIVLLALQRVDMPEAADAVRRGLRWMVGMQSRDGGMGAFDADNTGRLVGRIPFCDFGAVTDPPSADVTGHVLEACAAWGLAPSYVPVQRMVSWLLRDQDPDGAWFGRWGVNYVYGTAAAIPRCRPVSTGCSRCSTTTAPSARIAPPTTTRRCAAAAMRHRRRPPGGCRACAARGRHAAARRRGRRAGSSTTSARTASGTTSATPAPASRATSTFATTATRRISPPPRWAATGRCVPPWARARRPGFP